MSQTTQVRYATVAQLKTKYEALSGGVLLSLGYPGSDNINPEHAYIVRTTGLHAPDTFAARTARNDVFVVHIEFQAAADGQSDVAAYQRVEQLFAFLENAVADNAPALGLGTPPINDGLQWAHIGQVDGPYVVGQKLGWAGYLNCELSCTARYV
jgi:hypothetical protein